MSELSIEPDMPEEKLKEVPIQRKPEKARLEWVDMARGFVMLYLVATISFPGDSGLDLSGLSILRGLFTHASAGSGLITLYDLGAPAFLFLLGFTMPISFRKRKEQKGPTSARRYIIFRYLALLILGFVIANIDLEFLKYYSFPEGRNFIYEGSIPLYHRPVLYIIPWDVVPSIAIAGLVGFIFMGVRNPRYRFFLGYGWAILYQVGLYTTELDTYALNSIHGGVFGSIMGYGSIVIIATAMGDLIFFSDTIETKKYRGMLIFGIFNLTITVVVLYLALRGIFIPAFTLSKHLVSFPFIVTAIGLSCVVLWGFYQLNTRFKLKLIWLQIFGISPFFIYFIAEVPDSLFEILTDELGLSVTWWISLIWGLVVLGYCTYVAWYMHKNKKRVSTLKASLIFLVTILGILLIVILLDGFGVVDLLDAINTW
ncbi:MAG: hypothetical protein JW776_13645 [Candidatus Lokiarchaeota archaeon]|nr:hypothetical protein [Candidatus Lokiarchaeota archaeon]